MSSAALVRLVVLVACCGIAAGATGCGGSDDDKTANSSTSETTAATVPNPTSTSESKRSTGRTEEERVSQIVEGMYRDLAAGDAGGVCSVMSEAAQRQIAQNPPGGSTEPPEDRTCEKSVSVLLDTASRNGALPQAGNATVQGVKIKGRIATATVSIDGRAGDINLVRDGGSWRFADSGLQPRG